LRTLYEFERKLFIGIKINSIRIVEPHSSHQLKEKKRRKEKEKGGKREKKSTRKPKTTNKKIKNGRQRL